ncbi:MULTISPECIES: DDE-type integrase/transposase/recombinase [Xenorhabdus]|uniref:DDE-type integrase/transposase/recombinase n=1 Tax=Xenorhabdus TaxID=626 RepID=UPI0009081C5C
MSTHVGRSYLELDGQNTGKNRAVDSDSNIVDCVFTSHRDKTAALHFFKKSMGQHGQPDIVTMDKSGANKAAAS